MPRSDCRQRTPTHPINRVAAFDRNRWPLWIGLGGRLPSESLAALPRIPHTDSVGTRNKFYFAAQWLACTFPCRRFADILADACARLGADVVRYSFIVVDLHHLLLAGLPAHLCENAPARRIDRMDVLTIAVGS